MTDSKELLTKYIQYVGDCEGTDFICYLTKGGLSKFTDYEINELKTISDKLNER